MKKDELRYVLAMNIKRLRKELGMTQIKLAEYAGISEPYMNDIERCKTWISDATLVKLARALHVNEFELFIPQEQSELYSSADRETLKSLEEKKLNLLSHIDKCIEDIISNASDFKDVSNVK